MASATENHNKGVWLLLFLAWVLSVVSTLGALYIGEVMGQSPCTLCWYQRILMFPLAFILAVASYRADDGVWRYGLPLSGLGWVIAAYHSSLYFGIIPRPIEPCGAGPSCTSADMTIFGAVPIPLLSLIAFSGIIILLLFVWKRSPV